MTISEPRAGQRKGASLPSPRAEATLIMVPSWPTKKRSLCFSVPARKDWKFIENSFSNTPMPFDINDECESTEDNVFSQLTDGKLVIGVGSIGCVPYVAIEQHMS